MPKPSEQQLVMINRFAHTPRTAEDTFVFSPLMIDDQETCYSSVLQVPLLQKLTSDASKGSPLLMGHNNKQVPVGRSFNAAMSTDMEDGKMMNSVHGEFYIDLGRNTQAGMSTDDVAKGIDAGTIFDVSIGFSAKKWSCSLCGNDIRDYNKCPHIPGREYGVTGDDGLERVKKCQVLVGGDGNGELLELSLVYAGACDRATIKQTFSQESVRESEKGSNLRLVDDFKSIPMDATIYQYYTKDGSALFTDTDTRTNGTEILRKRSEDTVELEKQKEILSKFGIVGDTEETLTAALTANVDALTALTTELGVTVGELAGVSTELATAKTELESTTILLATKEATIVDLTAANEELTVKAGMIDTYRADLTKTAVEAGVRAQGNAFNVDLYEKFLGTLSIDEIKSATEGFNAEFAARFPGQKLTVTAKPKDALSADVAPDREDEELFRNYVAEKAFEYSKANSVSLIEATKLMYKKYTEDGSDN